MRESEWGECGVVCECVWVRCELCERCVECVCERVWVSVCESGVRVCVCESVCESVWRCVVYVRESV